MPKRIQRKRTKGWKMPPNTVYVGRPTFWGNPYEVGVYGDAERCVDAYRTLVYGDPRMCTKAKAELAGKDLACWCSPYQECHADVLLEIANRAEPSKG